MNDNRNSSNPIAARKAGAARRERRHVRTAVTTNVQLHAKANSCAKGEVPAVLNHDRNATQNAAIPTRPATRNTPASTMIV